MDRETNAGFRGGRFAAVALLGLAAGLTVVEFAEPERRFGLRRVSAEVELALPADAPLPTAADVRRRALSDLNLSAVLDRLDPQVDQPIAEVGDPGSAGPTDADPSYSDVVDAVAAERHAAALRDTAAVALWRKQLVVEVPHATKSEPVRVRFVIENAPVTNESRRLVEAVAVQYAGDAAVERWHGAVDRLLVAEEKADAATTALLDVVLAHRGPTAQAARPLPTIPPARRIQSDAGRTGPSPADKSTNPADPADDVGPELQRLTQQRERLLQSLEPAHPDVATIDARLSALRNAASESPIRRASVEIMLDAEPSFAPTELPDFPSSRPTSLTAVVAELEQARGVVQQRLGEMLNPAAVQLPIVAVTLGSGMPWESRSLWQIGVCVLAIAGAWLVSRRWNAEASPAAAIAFSAQGSSPTNTHHAEPRVQTVEQAASAVGAPVLAVLTRRRDAHDAVQ